MAEREGLVRDWAELTFLHGAMALERRRDGITVYMTRDSPEARRAVEELLGREGSRVPIEFRYWEEDQDP